MVRSAPKPAPKAKKARKPLKAKKWGVSSKPAKPIRKSGETKRKKVIRQKAFYSSAAWKRLRKEALERAGNQCEFSFIDGYTGYEWRCAETERLQVHHTSSHFGGDERPEHLRCLCRYHHAIVETRDFPHRQRSR